MMRVKERRPTGNYETKDRKMKGEVELPSAGETRTGSGGEDAAMSSRSGYMRWWWV